MATTIRDNAANVAPEFILQKLRLFVDLLKQASFNKLLDDFLQLSYNSLKWKKWMLKNTNATDYDRAIIAGHYIFSTDVFKELKNKVASKIEDLDDILKCRVKE